MTRSFAKHTLIEFYNCDPANLKRAREVKAIMCHAVRRGGGTIVKTAFHNFSPYGVSGVIVITESHVTIHTWPEHGYAAVDIFSCSKNLKQALIRSELRKGLKARRYNSRTFDRGAPGI